MGVTIHFEGRLRDMKALEEVTALAKSFAEEKHWPVELIDEADVTLLRVKKEQD